jgi:ATP-dependent helicase HrpB
VLGASFIPSELPIVEALPALLHALEMGRNAVLVAPPGAGKTTSVPLALLNASWREDGKIIMLAPRRLAARSAAARMASLLGETVGKTVGYRVRLDSKTSNLTRIEVVTEGVFTRMILDDPELSGVSAIIFDEVHERNLEGDIALALALDTQDGLREDLRLLAMSATLDGARIGALMGQARVVESAGKMFPVETIYVGHAPSIRLEIQAANLAYQALDKGPGDVLVFLPGVAEINRALAHLNTKPKKDFIAVGLHGGLEPRSQDEALAPTLRGTRKIIFATAIAETSLTIAGVSIVVDCGLSRRAAYEPDTGLTRLVTVRASRASADQRRGRAGRTSPGQCYRLGEEAQSGAFPAFDRPEILEADLAPMVLTLAVWGVSDPASLNWLDPPPLPAWNEAVALLTSLGGLDGDKRITGHGRTLAAFGLPPRLAHMIVESSRCGFGATAAWVAALLSERGLGGISTDLSARLIALQRETSPRAMKAKSQAMGWARQAHATDSMDPDKAGLALALAFPDRVAKARDRRGGFVLRSGRGGEIMPDEALSTAPFLAIGGLQGRASNARITEAAGLSRGDIDMLFGKEITCLMSTVFDKATGRLHGKNQKRLGALVLEERTAQLSPDDVAAGFYKAVLDHGLSVLSWSEAAVSLRARLAWLHAASPADWPDLSDAFLIATAKDWLLPSLHGVARLADVNLHDALLRCLDWQATQRLSKEAPAWFETPVGTNHLIDYASEQGPTVSVRVQEMFGLKVHPMLAGGRVAFVFQLLSPAHRPIAVTSDLPSFWRGAWGDVRKEMKARYPRHVWPEEPSLADPTTRAKPRGN